MTGRCTALVLAGATIVAGCGGGSAADRAGDTPEARRLAGAWSIRLQIDRSRFEAVAPSEALVREVRGDVALVANHWLAGNPRVPLPTLYGTYDIDFRPLGFDPRIDGKVPRVEAAARGRDSVDLVFEPADDRQQVRLRGAWIADSIIGRWELDGGRIGGDAAGAFTMKRRKS